MIESFRMKRGKRNLVATTTGSIRNSLMGMASLIMVCMLMPLAYLLFQAIRADAAAFSVLFSARTLVLLWDTFRLMAGVLVFVTTLAFPLAWLTTRTDLPAKTLVTWLGVLPLAMPGYVMAYGLLSLGGSYGMLAQALGWNLPRLSGYWGALLALSLTLYPYLFLNLRSAILGLNPSLEESARSLGLNAGQTWLKIVLPQLKPAFFSGWMLVLLHVLGDFGVVSLMRYRTFSFVLYQATESIMDRAATALLALFVLGLTMFLLWGEGRMLKGLRLDASARVTKRQARMHEIGGWKGAAFGFMGFMTILSLIAPLASMFYWGWLRPDTQALADLPKALWSSASAAVPAALGAALIATILSYLSLRFPSGWSRAFERMAYLGYATPPIVFGLSLVFLSLNAVPILYQTFTLLVLAYIFHAAAEAVGPIRSALYQAPPRLEEAARSLGCSPFQAFRKATFPLLKRGIAMSMALVFLSVMKELPITLLLSPIGFETLAVNVWSYTSTTNYGAAAPYALTIVALSAVFVGLLLRKER